jgi:glycosyltransferase involved in cell wall biosynthesis
MTSTSTLPITLLVITRNEADIIGRCLDSVPFAAEKVVIDSGSTDGTQEIARRHGARVVHQDWLGFGPQRNFANTQASYDWILVLDADEVLTPASVAELQTRLPSLLQSSHAGAILVRQTWYMGAPMRWYRPMVADKSSRIYHRQRARWTDVRVHESLIFNGTTQLMREPFAHFNNPTLVHRHLKILRYSELKARDWLDAKKTRWMWTCPFVFVATFIKDYFLRLAFLDGWRGYVAAHVAASYAVYKRLRYYEMQRNPVSREQAAQALKRCGLDH